MGRPGSFIKRFTDILISLIALVITSPFLLVAVIAIKLESKGSAFFLQERMGLKGEIFKVYKLRTMIQNADKIGPVLTQQNDHRITKTGRLLRLTSLDEIPQMLNVLKGEMSIIGPRPEVPSIAKNYTSVQREVFNYKPGITGIVQVSGRASLEIETKLKMDVEYYQRENFWRDLVILFKTPFAITSNDGNVM